MRPAGRSARKSTATTSAGPRRADGSRGGGPGENGRPRWTRRSAPRMTARSRRNSARRRTRCGCAGRSSGYRRGAIIERRNRGRSAERESRYPFAGSARRSKSSGKRSLRKRAAPGWDGIFAVDGIAVAPARLGYSPSAGDSGTTSSAPAGAGRICTRGRPCRANSPNRTRLRSGCTHRTSRPAPSLRPGLWSNRRSPRPSTERLPPDAGRQRSSIRQTSASQMAGELRTEIARASPGFASSPAARRIRGWGTSGTERPEPGRPRRRSRRNRPRR